MTALTRDDLMSLERYAEERAEFRSRVLAHKKLRTLPVGPNATLYFEDRLTVQYQVQEMLRIERIFEAAGIQEELDAYNPLIPGGRDLKATFMIEFPDVDERREALARMKGVEHHVYLVVDGQRQMAIADEDLERSDEDKTSAVHFLRIPLSEGVAAALKGGAPFAVLIDHEAYRHSVDPVPEAIRAALVADLR